MREKLTLKAFGLLKISFYLLTFCLYQPALAQFEDVNAQHWANQAILWANENQIMSGPGDKPGLFEPSALANRAQWVTALSRFNQFLEKDLSQIEARMKQIDHTLDALGTELKVNHHDGVVIDSDLTFEQAMLGLDPNCTPEIKNSQVLLDVQYYSFDDKIHQGQIVVDQSLEAEVKAIFGLILKEEFPLQSVIPVSEFGWSDEASMQANNTSGFNYRTISGTDTLSNHAQGLAIDLNPFLNPYIKQKMGEGKTVEPAGAVYNATQPGTLSADSPIVQMFKMLGWEWGGEWSSPDYLQLSDYQHFEKIL